MSDVVVNKTGKQQVVHEVFHAFFLLPGDAICRRTFPCAALELERLNELYARKEMSKELKVGDRVVLSGGFGNSLRGETAVITDISPTSSFPYFFEVLTGRYTGRKSWGSASELRKLGAVQASAGGISSISVSDSLQTLPKAVEPECTCRSLLHGHENGCGYAAFRKDAT